MIKEYQFSNGNLHVYEHINTFVVIISYVAG